MAYVFDSSSIYALVKLDKPEALARNYTCNLARYELGNILLTEMNLRKAIGEIEQRSLLSLIMRALNVMLIVNVNDDEQGVMDLATKYKLSFYDASYVYAAKKHAAVLVTQDERLSKDSSSAEIVLM